MSALYDPTLNTPDPWLLGEPPLPVSSVGIVLTSGLLEEDPYFLFVEQRDQPSNPWGIPAGRVEHADKSALSALARELREETGLELPKDVPLFYVLEKCGKGYAEDPTSAKLVFTGS